MSKKELVKTLMERMQNFGYFPSFTNVKIFIREYEKLTKSEQQKPVVPQFVADWIEYCKFTNVNLQNALFVGDVYFYNYANQKDFSKLKEFLDTENNQELFARAWLDGYEVEKEKRYTVKIKGMEKDYNFLNLIIFQNAWVLSSVKIDKKFRSFHTKKQLEEAGFGWVFDCPGVEVQEVERCHS